MINLGWIKLYRELKSKSIWQLSTPQQKVVLITILMTVNHEENKWEWKGERFICKPGQMITSLNSLVKECGPGVTIQNVRSAIERFEKLGFLTNESTKTGRLVTVVNWEKYQGSDFDDNKDINKQLTKSQQRPNKQLTTIKEYKNDNNEKNEKKCVGVYSSPTLDEIKSFCLENNLEVDYDKFYDYYESINWTSNNGRKITNWQSKIKYWDKQDKCKKEKNLSYQERMILQQKKAAEEFLKGE